MDRTKEPPVFLEELENVKDNPDRILEYLKIAASLREHEFNIQVKRNAMYISANAGLIVFLGFILKGEFYVLGAWITFLGIILSIFWDGYIKKSTNWVHFWERSFYRANNSYLLTWQIIMYKTHILCYRNVHGKNRCTKIET